MDLSAVSFPPARCLGAREKTAPSVLRRPWRFDVLLVAVQSSVVPGSRRSPGRRGVGKRGAQEPRWCRGHGADLSAVSFPPARCLSALERKYPPGRGGCGGSMSSWLPSRARWSLGPGVRWEDDERVLRQIGPSAFFRFLRALPSFPPRKRGPRSRDGAAVTGMDLSAVDIPPARCLGARERKHPPCRGGCGGSMSFWLPSRARWSLGPGVRREDEG